MMDCKDMRTGPANAGEVSLHKTAEVVALRVTANENREMRMQEAERKAASLPAKLTVPMIIFFLPCLFVVILGPAIITIRHMMH